MLTVAIPTYNRVSKLIVLLDSIIAQIDDSMRGCVRILISDNASTDDTAKTVYRYMDRTPTMISYFKNETNLGYSRNVQLAVERAETDFVLLMSDDDALEAGALGPLIDVVRRHSDEASLVFSSAVTYDEDLAVRRDDANEKHGELFYPNGIDYLKAAHSFPPALVSGYVVRKRDWEKYGHASLHSKSIIVHLLAAMDMCLAGCGVVVSGINLVKYRADGVSTSATWELQPLYPFRFLLDCLQGRKDVLDRCPKDVARLLYAASMRSIILYLVRQRIVHHPFDVQAFWKWFREVREVKSPYTVIAYLTRVIPDCVLNLLFGRLVARYPIAMPSSKTL